MDLSRTADEELPRIWGEVTEEMLARKIITSRNHPIASLGERVAAEHLGGILAPPNTKGYDLLVGRKKIEVKAVRERHSDHVNGYILTLQKIRKHPRTRPIDVLPKWSK